VNNIGTEKGSIMK